MKYNVKNVPEIIKALNKSIKTHNHILDGLADDPEYNTAFDEGYIKACEYAIALLLMIE